MIRTNFRTAVAAAIAAAALMGAPMARAAAGVVPGEQRRWALDFRVRLEQPGGERPVEIGLSGEWVSTISAVRPGEYDTTLQIAGARITGDGISRAPAGAQDELRRRLARPFWATYRDDGAILSVHFFKDVGPSDRNLLQMIATETQLVRPDPGLPVWTVLERDGAGSYLAIYHRSEPNHVVKRKLKYVRTDGVAGAPADGLQVSVDQSELCFSLDPDEVIAALDGSARVRIGLPGAQPGDQQAGASNSGQLATITVTHLANLRRSRAPEWIGSLARALPHVVSSPIVTHKPDPDEARARRDDRLLEGRTTESLLEAAMSKSGDPERLTALFRQRSGAVEAALALLRKSGPLKQITDALGAAGSPAAVEALGRMALDEAAPGGARADALTALILIQHPTPEAMRIPAAVLDDGDAAVQSAARMVSGALARAGRAEHPAEADAIDAALIARYGNARTVRDLSELLAGLGNSVGPSALPVIQEALRDPSGPVRAAAARALRLAPGAGIDALLAATITSDNDPSVRGDAIFAAGFRRPLGPPLGEALLRAARADPVDYVRSNAISLLRRNPGASPRIVETLEWIAENDAMPGIRRLARETLAFVQPGPLR